MADLDFKHNVSQIPAGAALPEYKGTGEKANPSPVPDYQSAFHNYASSTNWMSDLGSSVAMNASNAMARKIGADLGKNPQGDIGPSFTDFDKNLEQSYATQAESTLGIQAQKLISQSNLELAQAPRLSGDMIAKKQDQVYKGLQQIYSLAPDSIRPHMEHQYSSVMLQQNEHLTNRMLSDQKQDRRENAALSSKVNAQNAYSLELNGVDLDKNGYSKAAVSAYQTVERTQKSLLATHDTSPAEAKSEIDTARQSMITGRVIREGLIAEREKRLPEFKKKLAENPPDYISTEDHDAVYRNFTNYMAVQANLKADDENLKKQQMYNHIVESGGNVTTSEMEAFKQQVSPLAYEQMQFRLIQQKAKEANSNALTGLLSQHWEDPTVIANATADHINKTFNEKVNYAVENSQKTTIPLRSPRPLTRDEAEVLVAARAGGEIPVFTRSLQNKLKNPNPTVVGSAVMQIHSLRENGNGQALAGLNEKDNSMFTAAEIALTHPDPIKAIQAAHDRIYNENPEVQKQRQTIFTNLLHKANSSGVPNDQFALSAFNLKKSNFINPTIASAYGLSILTELNNNFTTSGDFNEAKTTTKRWVDENYGDTFINGGRHTTLNPIEKMSGFSGPQGNQYIKMNIVDQLNEKLIPLKSAYDSKTANEYWETIPVHVPKTNNSKNFLASTGGEESLSQRLDIQRPHLELGSKNASLAELLHHQRNKSFTVPSDKPSGINEPVKLKRTMRTKDGIKTDVFNVILIGNAYGSYDVSVESRTGMKSLYREAPYLGIMSITPDVKAIQTHFMKDHGSR